MDIKPKLIFAFVFSFLIICINACGKLGRGCADTKFSFQTGIRAYPGLDSIHIGDTVWFEANVPTSLTDIKTNQLIDYSGAVNMGTYISLDQFTGGSIADPGTTYAAGEFKLVLLTGNESNNKLPERIRSFLFIESGKQYSLKFGIVPQKKGIYIASIGNPSGVYRKSDACTKAGYNINFINTKQHLYLYQNNRPGYVIQGLELTNTYSFKVY